MRCVTKKGKYYEAMNIKGFSDRGSYTKYKIWITLFEICIMFYLNIKGGLYKWGILENSGENVIAAERI